MYDYKGAFKRLFKDTGKGSAYLNETCESHPMSEMDARYRLEKCLAEARAAAELSLTKLAQELSAIRVELEDVPQLMKLVKDHFEGVAPIDPEVVCCSE